MGSHMQFRNQCNFTYPGIIPIKMCDRNLTFEFFSELNSIESTESIEFVEFYF